MTQEEKAKAYDDALLRADKAVQKGCLDKDMFDIIFPPEESEDERTRKEIVDFLRFTLIERSIKNGKEKADKWIAYLEKQKEPKQEIISISEMVSKYRNTDEYDDDGNYKGKPVNCMIRAYEQGIRDTLSKVKEQKPAWSEEDEKKRGQVIKILEQANENWRTAQGSVPFGTLISWLKSLRPSWKPSEEYIRKDALLEWAKEVTKDATHSIVYRGALRDLIDKIDKLESL